MIIRVRWKKQKLLVLLLLFSSFVVASEKKISEEVMSKEIIEQIAEKTAEKLAEKLAGKSAEKLATDNKKESQKNVSDSLKTEKKTSENGQESSQQNDYSVLSETINNNPLLNQKAKILRMGSGVVGGNYFVLGELVGGVISHPMGSLSCGQGGTCGVPNLQTQNVTSAGSMANLAALEKGDTVTGFVQSDLAYWAYTGTGIFEKRDKIPSLRAIASLYPEAVHIVIRKNSKIQSVADFVDKRVSVGARKSGTLLLSRLVLDAYKITEDDMQTEYLNNQQSIERLKTGELDAMFFSVGAPAPALSQLFAESDDFTLLAIDESALRAIFKQGHYFSPYTIPEGTYEKTPTIKTISVYALWLCLDDADESLIYQLTKALWSDTSKQLLNSSYIGQQVNVSSSLDGIGIPLHPGAKKYYTEIGKRF